MKKILLSMCALLCLSVANAQTLNSVPYCKPIFSPLYTQNPITNVTLGSINNNTSATTNSTIYIYYNNLTAPTLTAGSSYAMSITVNKLNPEPNVLTVYADYNRDNNFDASELVYNTNAVGASSVTGSVTYTPTMAVPASASSGTTRIRVIFTDSASTSSVPAVPFSASSCFAYTASTNGFRYGEVEDYNINIVGGSTPLAPTVVTTAATSVTSNSATINGTVNANGTSTVDSFQYGLTTSYGSTQVGIPGTVTGSTATSVFVLLSGLASGTTYHYRVFGTNTGGTTYGSDMTFTTSTITQPAPSVVTVTATGITTTTATLNGTVNANGASTVDSFQYGPTTSYGTTVVGSPATVTGTTLTGIGATVSGLTPNTTYHYRAKGVNSGGTSYGADLVFTTSSVTQPTASLVATSATSITTTTAMLNGTVNANGSNTLDSFQYGLTTAYGTTKSGSPGTITSSVVTNVSVPITGLAANTTYHYRLKGVNSGGTSYSNDMVFTTVNNVGVTNVSGNDELLVYPNPSNGSVTIEPGAGKRTIPVSAKIYDITGKQIAGSYADNNGAIHFTNLAPQIYLLTISDNKGNSIKQKLVVQ